MKGPVLVHSEIQSQPAWWTQRQVSPDSFEVLRTASEMVGGSYLCGSLVVCFPKDGCLLFLCPEMYTSRESFMVMKNCVAQLRFSRMLITQNLIR